ncbi:MAG: RNA polymerase sigma factor [Planctomycetota bacterium]|nr:RNA polymerase sigma factor [Planctomycetota bacterium]
MTAWYPRLFRTALRLTGSAEDAADLTQQAFCKALGTWDRFDGAALATTWLHQILLNCVRDWARRRAVRNAPQVEEWNLLPAIDGAPDGREGLEKQEQGAAVRKAVEELPGDVRSALVVTVIDGYSYAEAAELLQVPVGTIASRVYKARALLRAAMGDATEEV